MSCLLNTVLIDLQKCVTHMACSMTCYTAEWEASNESTCHGFTADNMRRQLGRAMRAFMHAAPTLVSQDIYSTFMAHESITSPSLDFPTFLPWGEELPFTLAHRDA